MGDWKDDMKVWNEAMEVELRRAAAGLGPSEKARRMAEQARRCAEAPELINDLADGEPPWLVFDDIDREIEQEVEDYQRDVGDR